MVKSSKESLQLNIPDRLRSLEPTLAPGSLIFWVCDGTDNDDQAGITNGVKRTQLEVVSQLRKMGYQVMVIYPKMCTEDPQQGYFSLLKNFVGYDGFDVAINPYKVWYLISRFKPDGVMVSTIEGPLGQAIAMAHNFPSLVGLSRRSDLPYVASFTTRIDMFVAQAINHFWKKVHLATKIPGAIPDIVSSTSFESILNLLYQDADKVLVPTESMLEELKRMGMSDLDQRGVVWPRGVNESQWRLPTAGEENPYQSYPWYTNNPDWPVVLYYGRVSVEKNIDAFLSAKVGSAHLVVIGDGPYLAELVQKYPEAHFLGKMHADKLSAFVRFANVHFFSSLTDTFGNTLLEAGASGVPSVGFSGVPGPQDIIIDGTTGYLIKPNEDIGLAVAKALQIDHGVCSSSVVNRYSWKNAANKLLLNMTPTAFFSQREEGHLDKQFR